MASDYCDKADQVIIAAGAQGIKAYLLAQRGFEDGKHGKDCA